MIIQVAALCIFYFLEDVSRNLRLLLDKGWDICVPDTAVNGTLADMMKSARCFGIILFALTYVNHFIISAMVQFLVSGRLERLGCWRIPIFLFVTINMIAPFFILAILVKYQDHEINSVCTGLTDGSLSSPESEAVMAKTIELATWGT